MEVHTRKSKDYQMFSSDSEKEAEELFVVSTDLEQEGSRERCHFTILYGSSVNGMNLYRVLLWLCGYIELDYSIVIHEVSHFSGVSQC